MAIEHKNIVDAERHEPKGASTAASGEVIISNGDGTTSFGNVDYTNVDGRLKKGMWNFDDAGTSVTPIDLTLADTWYYLTNDGAGANTILDYKIDSIGNLWDTSTNSFDISNFNLGDWVEMRIDIEITTGGANHTLDLEFELASGTGSAFGVPIRTGMTFKNADTYRVAVYTSTFVGSAMTRDNPVKLRIRSDSTGDSVEVNGWFMNALTTA